MTIPNPDRAIIAAETLTEYLLNAAHRRGGSEARVRQSVGYQSENPQLLDSDLRLHPLSLEVARTHENAYGIVYEIEGPIRTPSGRTVRFCSVWQVDTG